VGIIYRGRMVKEGPIDELLSLSDQTEIILRDASPELLAKVRELVGSDGTAELIRAGRPKTTLERLFLQETVDRRDP
jgi:ABC-2 type transport system ATP-binding protein